MAKRFLKLRTVATTALAASGLYVALRVDPNDLGVVRIGRAAITTAVISYDYMTSLKKLQRGTDEYEAVKSLYLMKTAFLPGSFSTDYMVLMGGVVWKGVGECSLKGANGLFLLKR
uniref:AarF domain containing kinase 1 n=1 Tax=Callorhinchus milii TaxID=7868 RepID=A0A4W3JB54_CALMI